MKLEKNYKIYRNIDTLPVWYWDKIQQTGDVRWLVQTDDIEQIKETEQLYEIYDKIYTEYYDYFGISSDLKEYLNAQRSITLMELDIAVNNNKSKLSLLERKKIEFSTLYGNAGNDIDKLAVSISRYFKVDVDLIKISTKRFYNFLNTLIKENNG